MNRYGLKLMKDEQQALRARYNNSENKYEKQIISDVLTVMRDYETNHRLVDMAADNLKDKLVEYCYEEDHPNEVALDGVVRAAEQYKALKGNLERTEATLRDVKNMLAYADMRP